MAAKTLLPPDPHHAVLKKIYPWDKYNIVFVMEWLYEQAKQTGFVGTYEDFKLRYGAFVKAADPQQIEDLIQNYEGAYHITPLLGITQTLETKNKVLNQNITVDAIPSDLINSKKTYTGRYEVTPMADIAQVLNTNNKIMEDNVTVEKIPYAETSNAAGGYTVIIG